MTDFSKTNLHCSSIYNIMGGKPDKKTNLDWYNSFNEKYLSYKSKYDEIPIEKRSLKPSIKLSEQVVSSRIKMLEYSLIKDDEPLSVGCKSHLKKVYAYAKYGKWSACQEKGTKYTSKGIIGEGESIKLLSQVRGILLSKNEERVSNDFLTGIPDIFLGKSIMEADNIIDIKSSWDIETFMDNLGKPLNIQYWWQIQGYMSITGATVGEVSYCLVTTPEYILGNEKRKLFERMEVVTSENPDYKKKESELINNMTFDDMPAQDRVIRFLVERDDEAIDKIYRRVEKCRKYLSEIEEMHSQGVFLAKDEEESGISDDNS